MSAIEVKVETSTRAAGGRSTASSAATAPPMERPWSTMRRASTSGWRRSQSWKASASARTDARSGVPPERPNPRYSTSSTDAPQAG